jgi:GTP-binding protein
MSKKLDFARASFLSGVPRAALAPPDQGREVAFAGRSNAGKSSALNAIVGRRALARTSKTPGRTQELNFFQLEPDARLVDLPGYGYARVPGAVKARWQAQLNEYLHSRASLSGVVLLMDCRHPLTPADQQMLHWCGAVQLPVHILLTKADKLRRGPASAAQLAVRARLAGLQTQATTQLFSVITREGVEQARELISAWLETE